MLLLTLRPVPVCTTGTRSSPVSEFMSNLLGSLQRCLLCLGFSEKFWKANKSINEDGRLKTLWMNGRSNLQPEESSCIGLGRSRSYFLVLQRLQFIFMDMNMLLVYLNADQRYQTYSL